MNCVNTRISILYLLPFVLGQAPQPSSYYAFKLSKLNYYIYPLSYCLLVVIIHETSNN